MNLPWRRIGITAPLLQLESDGHRHDHGDWLAVHEGRREAPIRDRPERGEIEERVNTSQDRCGCDASCAGDRRFNDHGALQPSVLSLFRVYRPDVADLLRWFYSAARAFCLQRVAGIATVVLDASNEVIMNGNQDRHGYAIMQDVAARTDGRLKLSPGTLYGSIKRMLEEGLIVEIDERPGPDEDDERRRYYRITRFGRQVAQAEADRLTKLLRQARAAGLVARRV